MRWTEPGLQTDYSTFFKGGLRKHPGAAFVFIAYSPACVLARPARNGAGASAVANTAYTQSCIELACAVLDRLKQLPVLTACRCNE